MIPAGRNIEDFEYDVEKKTLDLYSGGDIVATLNPLSLIKKNFHQETAYIICDQMVFICFDKIGTEINSVPVEEVIDLWQTKGLTEKLYKRYIND